MILNIRFLRIINEGPFMLQTSKLTPQRLNITSSFKKQPIKKSSITVYRSTTNKYKTFYEPHHSKSHTTIKYLFNLVIHTSTKSVINRPQWSIHSFNHSSRKSAGTIVGGIKPIDRLCQFYYAVWGGTTINILPHIQELGAIFKRKIQTV